MLVIGCGPIGLELSQAMSRMGCKVTCFERSTQLLTREDPDAGGCVCVCVCLYLCVYLHACVCVMCMRSHRVDAGLLLVVRA